MSDETPTYSDVEVVHDTGRKSFSAPEETGGGIDTWRNDFSAASRSRSAGVFGRAPETQRDETIEAEPLTPDEAIEILGESFALRTQLEETQDELAWANEAQLDSLAFSQEYEDRESIAAAAETLLAAGGGERMEALLYRWAEIEGEAAAVADWTERAEHALTVEAGRLGAQQAREMESAVTTAYAGELATFYEQHPEYATGSPKNQFLAMALAKQPNLTASPEDFRTGLAAAREEVESVASGALKVANEMDFRDQFRQEAHRSFRPPTAEHTASATARRVGPQSPEELAAEFTARAKGTQSQRQAALEARDADFRASFADSSRGSGFGDGAREQAAAAIKAREEEQAGLRPPNRSI